ESPESALEKLDAALHESMTCGQNTPVVFDEELGEMLHRTKLLANQLRDALVSPTDSALEVCFRPTVRTSNGVPVRAEAYLRMYSAEYGMIGAATLLPIAEETGIACALNLFMLRAACVMARTLLNAGCVFESISVPLSAVQFLQKGFCTELSALLKEYEIPANKLALEITESTLINSFAQISETLEEIAALDMETSLSDFGTGYSGVSNILNLPVATLKLDRLFVFQMVEDARCCGVIEGLISIAHKLGMKVIAEGVENEFQKEALTRYGCDYQQGFYYSATLPPPELLALFQEQLK
ncbi:MAG: EAL domain-containing protein, partial [Pygmaiobacter sp.]